MGVPAETEGCGESVELFVASLAERGLAHSTVLSRISALRFMFRRAGLSVPFESPRLSMMLKGLKLRSPRSVAPRKAPVTSSHLVRMDRACSVLSPESAAQFRAMISVAFYGFLRPSEFCRSPRGHYLCVKDVRFLEGRGECLLHFSSYKHSIAPATVKLVDMPGEALHPVSLLRSYLSGLGSVARADALFPVSSSAFSATMAVVCQEAGIKSRLTPHCFRHGGATWAGKRGWASARIRAHGRWRSDAYTAYIRSY